MSNRATTEGSWRVAVDIGGTFTDCVLVDPTGEVTIGKSLSVRENPTDGVLDAVAAAATKIGLECNELLRRLALFVHGNTIGTNALIERNGARIGLLTTAGHEDNLLIGRVFSKRAGLSERQIIHTSHLNKPEPIVPRSRIRGVPERIDADGDVVITLDEQAVVDATQALVDDGIEALAISFLWSFANARHERRARDLIAQRWPQLAVTISSDVAPILGEYERTVTTALNSYLQPSVGAYLLALDRRLKEAGFNQKLMVIQSGGGVASMEHVARKAVLTIDSGPAGGVLGCRFLGERIGEPNLVCTDVGGTSFDVGLIHQGAITLETDPVIAQFVYRAPKIRVKSIGAGGGSIAWIDELGVMHVGPRSAGARPGPACYGRGGTLPTVTDADLVLGFLNPDNFLGGRMKLDADASHAAIATLAHKLNKSVLDTAYGIYEIINANMADLIRTMTIEQGHDPRDFAVVAYGGAGGLHAVGYSADIDAKAIYVPREATVFSAFGMLSADTMHTLESSRPTATPMSGADIGAINILLDQLTESVLATFSEEGIKRERVQIRRTVNMRYTSQVHELAIELPQRDLVAADEVEIVAQFTRRYSEIYGEEAVFAGGKHELLTFRVEGTSPLRTAADKQGVPSRGAPGRALKGTRKMYFGPAHGLIDGSVFDGDQLAAAEVHQGPAVVERYGDAIVVPPGYEFKVDPMANIVIRRVGGK